MDFNAMSVITLLIGLVIGVGGAVALTFLLGNSAGKKLKNYCLMLKKKLININVIVY